MIAPVTGGRGVRGLAFAAPRAIVAATFSATARSAMLRVRLLLALCGALAVAACGVKGPLEPPPGAQAPAPPQATAAAAPQSGAQGYVAPRTAAEMNESAIPHADWEKQKKPPGSASGSGGSQLLQGIQRPQQPFVLDGLL